MVERLAPELLSWASILTSRPARRRRQRPAWAIEASAGKPGLIPGSMGTASYVVTGRGDPVSLNSSPHGAGRAYSRSKARRTFSQDDLRAAMVGIEYRDTAAFVDEIPAAYKDIDQVMADAADLVEVRHTLHQLINVKGD